MFSGQWPEPQIGPNRIEGGKLIPVSEIERRAKFFEAIEESHPLMELIHRCIKNDPQLRPHAGEISRQVSRVATQFPASFANRLEMLRRIATVEEEKRALTEEGERKDRAVQQKESQISLLREEIRAKEEEKIAEIDQLKLAHSSEVEQLRLQVRDLNTQKQFVIAKMEAEVAELKSNATVYKSQIEANSRAQFQEQKQFKQVIIQDREANKKLIADLQSDLSTVKSENANLLCTILELQADTAEKDGVIKMKEAVVRRKDSELEAKSRALGEKDATISAMSEQLTKTREYLATTKLQVCVLNIYTT
jgi:chromosome segregation ATPase